MKGKLGYYKLNWLFTMKKPIIKSVDNNKSKGKTYTELINMYNKAMSNGFYGEAEIIVYAFIEDRLKSLLSKGQCTLLKMWWLRFF